MAEIHIITYKWNNTRQCIEIELPVVKILALRHSITISSSEALDGTEVVILKQPPTSLPEWLVYGMNFEYITVAE